MGQGLFGGSFRAVRNSQQPRAALPSVQAPYSQQPVRGLIGGSSPKPNFLESMIGYDPVKSDLGGWDYFRAGNQERQDSKARVSAQQAQQQMLEQARAAGLDPRAMLALQLDPASLGKSLATNYEAANVDAGNSRVFGNGQPTYTAPGKGGSEIRQVGNSIVEQQQDGSWKPVYTGSTPAETARAFQGFIDQSTGEQMLVMSDGTIKGTGRKAYVPPQISSFGGVPVAVDKRTLETSQLAGLGAVADNKAALASAEVQGKAQGQAAFDLPGIEMRTQTAISSIDGLKRLNLNSRYGAQSKIWAVPGTEGADVQARINQVTSQAFLNAFDQLRGAGAITQTEGEAATAAITRLKNQNITVGEALQAMDDLQNYYAKGLSVAKTKSRMAPTLPNRQASGSELSQYSTEELQRMLAGGQ